MGILTNQESARSFSSYVTAFGLALLISSIIYLNRLDSSDELIHCNNSTQSISPGIDLSPSCSQVGSWRAAAVVGIVIGVIDALIVPFLCCCLCCTACGCAICVAIGCPEVFSENNQTNTQSTTKTTETEFTETATINVEENISPAEVSKYDVENVPSKLHKWLNAIGWILWVFAPFVATLYIVIALYKYDAIRTRNDDLFKGALALFIIALFNLMVYFQKMMNSSCGYGQKKISEKK